MTQDQTIAIIGGGVIGSAAAYFITGAPGFAGRVVVLEPDPSYARSSTARSAAAIRQQFNLAVNIQLSQASYAFLAGAEAALAVDGRRPALGLTERGYLVLTPPDGTARLRRAYELQRALGVAVDFLEPAALRARFPWIATDDLGAGCLGLAQEGYFDALALTRALRQKAEAQGARYIAQRVIAMRRAGDRIAELRLADGTTLAPDLVLNAAGAQAGRVAALAEVALPIESRKRCAFVFRADADPASFPNLVDPTFGGRGVFVRPYGAHFMAVTSPDPADDPDTSDDTVDAALFDQIVRPALARRARGFTDSELVEAWAGHYEMNTLDQNAIVGRHPQVANLLLACGFSGHGVMHAPAAGRAIAELITAGRYQTIDLSPLGVERVLAGRPLDDPQASEGRGPVPGAAPAAR